MYKRVSKRQCSIARQRAVRIIYDVQKFLKEKYVFAWRLVGSGAWGTMVENDNGEYDLDYQLLLTASSKAYTDNELSNSTQIKKDFISAFNKAKNGQERIQDSTTAITLINTDSKPYHIDFVIIRLYPDNHEIIRRNNTKEKPSVNTYTWNELPKWNEAYAKFKQLSPLDKQYLINEIIIPKKALEKAKEENDSTIISSSELFVREVNNYKCQSKKK